MFLTAGHHTHLIMGQNLLKFRQRIHEAAVVYHKAFCSADHQRIMKNPIRSIQKALQRAFGKCHALHPFIPGIIGIKSPLCRIKQCFRIYFLRKTAHSVRQSFHFFKITYCQHQIISVLCKLLRRQVRCPCNIHFIFLKVCSVLIKKRPFEIHVL